MNNQTKVHIKSENNESKTIEVVPDKHEENQILKDNNIPNENNHIEMTPNHVEIPMTPDVEVGKNKNPKKEIVKKIEGTVSPYKNQVREKKQAREIEFKWKNLVISAKPDNGCCTKYDPEVHKEKVKDS
jgi:hypothetical protein